MIQQSLSIIMPVYNEAGIIESVVREYYEKVVKKLPDTKFIIAEDGSTDGTKEILKRLQNALSFILLSGDKRKGYSKAFRNVLGIAETDLVFFSDSDGQHDPEDIFKLLKEIERYDIVGGYKFPRKDPLHRIIISKVYNLLIYLLFGLKMKDINSGFKLIRKKLISEILKDIGGFRYCIMSEFILKAYLSGYKIKEVPVRHYPRRFGSTAIFHPMKLPLIIIGLIKNLLKIKFTYMKNKNK